MQGELGTRQGRCELGEHKFSRTVQEARLIAIPSPPGMVVWYTYKLLLIKPMAPINQMANRIMGNGPHP